MIAEIRELTACDVEAAVELWQKTDLARPWNDPKADALRAIAGPSSIVLGAFEHDWLVAAAMTGWDGHRGWIYYLAVTPSLQRRGLGKRMVGACEAWLKQHFDAPKLQLMVRTENLQTVDFYEAIGFDRGDFLLFARTVAIR